MALISQIPFESHTPESWMSFVKGLKVITPESEKKERKKAPPYVASLSEKTGKLCIRFHKDRKKWLLRNEVDTIAKDLSLPLNEVWNEVMIKKKIKIYDSELHQQESEKNKNV